MSDQCHICGPVKHEAPTVICAPCALEIAVDLARRMGVFDSARIEIEPEFAFGAMSYQAAQAAQASKDLKVRP